MKTNKGYLSDWIQEEHRVSLNDDRLAEIGSPQCYVVLSDFDLDKWARYFAIMDITGAYHGSLVKSVKSYYNPTTALFEPIGYDLHKGAGEFNDFILRETWMSSLH